MSDADEDYTEKFPINPKRKSLWLKATAAILPALLAGIFALIPNIFDRFTASKSRLTYTVISSPSINVGSAFTRIYSVSIENAGSTKLTGVTASMAVSAGKIERSSLGDRDGEQTRLEVSADQNRISVRSMFPKERVSAVLLVSTPSPLIKPTFSVRSDEVLGDYQDTLQDEEDKSPSTVVAILAAIGALIATLGLLIFIKRDRDSYESFIPARISQTYAIEPSDFIRVIVDAIDDIQLRADLRKIGYETTFAEFGRMLSQKIAVSRKSERFKFLAGLRAILLVPHVQESSRTLIRGWLIETGAPLIDAKTDDTVINDLKSFRMVVEDLFSRELNQSKKRSILRKILRRH